MPSSRSKKDWSQMTRREIVTALALFTGIGVAVAAACIHSVLHSNDAFGRLVPAAGVLFVASIIVLFYVQAFRELRRRRRHDS